MSDGGSEIISCNQCGARNRAVFTGDKQPVCGRCKSPLAKRVGPVVLTDATFEQLLDETEQPILIDMWAAWCGPCRMIAPIIDALAGEFSGRAVVAKLDVDANPRTASRFGVRSIPTLLILKGGREVDRIVGVQSAEALRARLERQI
jgi:thioredoxin